MTAGCHKIVSFLLSSLPLGVPILLRIFLDVAKMTATILPTGQHLLAGSHSLLFLFFSGCCCMPLTRLSTISVWFLDWLILRLFFFLSMPYSLIYFTFSQLFELPESSITFPGIVFSTLDVRRIYPSMKYQQQHFLLYLFHLSLLSFSQNGIQRFAWWISFQIQVLPME